jgi:hypothetical protein
VLEQRHHQLFELSRDVARYLAQKRQSLEGRGCAIQCARSTGQAPAEQPICNGTQRVEIGALIEQAALPGLR